MIISINKNGKRFVLIVSVFLLLLLLLPVFSGSFTKHKFKQVIQRTAAFSGASAKIVTYKQGWFSSDAVVVFSLSSNDFIASKNQLMAQSLKKMLAKADFQQLTLSAHILHGPIVLNKAVRLAQGLIVAKINLTCDPKDTNALCVNNNPIAAMDMFVALFGNTEINVVSPAVNYAKNDIKFEWLGLTAHFRISDLFDSLQSEIHWNGMNLFSKDTVFQITEFSDNYSRVRKSGNLYFGSNKIGLKFFSLQDKNKYKAEGNNVAVNSSFHEQHGLFGGETTVDIMKFVLNDDSYSNISVDWSTDKFNGSVVAKLHERAVQLRSMARPSTSEIKDTFNLLTRLLNNNAKFSLNKFDIVTPWGKAYANADIIFKTRNRNLEGFFAIFANSDFNVNLVIEKNLAKHLLENYYKHNVTLLRQSRQAYQPDLLLAKFENLGLVTSDSNSYLMSLSYKNNKIFMNNQPFSLF